MPSGHTVSYVLTSGAYSPAMNTHGFPHQCVCCGRDLGLPSGDRGLCDGCDEDIPNHIPEEQYLIYMKELWRKR